MTARSSTPAHGRHEARVVVLTALPVEYEEVRVHLQGDCADRRLSGGTAYTVGSFKGRRIDWTVAVAEIGAGNVGTAIEATKAIMEFKPDLLLFVGVAGSLKPVDAPRGSVVVADVVYGYQGGKAGEKFAPRGAVFRTPFRLTQQAKVVGREWSPAEDIPMCVASIAAGDVVVASSDSPTFGMIRNLYNSAVAVEMESEGLYAAAERTDRQQVMSIRGISDCVDDKSADDDVKWQPVAARNAASFAFAMLEAIKPEDLGGAVRPGAEGRATEPEEPGEVAEAEDTRGPSYGEVESLSTEAPEWGKVPSSVTELLKKAGDLDEAEAARLLSILAQGQSDPRATLDGLLTDPPRWLLNADSDLLWAAIGEFAAGHNIQAAASEAFRRAMMAGGDAALWLASSAVALFIAEGDTSKALESLAEAEKESPELPVSLARAVIESDTAAVLDLTEDADGQYLHPSSYRIQALHHAQRIPEAIDLGQRTVDLHPGAAGLALLLARMLIQGAHENCSPLGYDASLLRARELALAARDLRRGWKGDSIEATVLAGQASMMLRDTAEAINICSLPPNGNALPVEAADERVTQLRVDALLALGRREEALSEAAALSDNVLRTLVEANCLDALGRKDRAEERYRDAVEALEEASLDDPEAVGRLSQGLLGLAHLGVTPLPSIDRLREARPEAARQIEIFSDINRGESKAAIQKLGGTGQPSDVDLLVEALIKSGQADDALLVLKTAAEQQGRNDYRLRAVNVLTNERRFADAYKVAFEALALVTDGTPLKTLLRRAAVESAAMMSDWNAVREQAKAAEAAGDKSGDIRWALVFALNNTLNVEDALAEATCEPPLEPRNEQEALLLMSLHSISGTGLASVSAVLDIAEMYPTSEEIRAVAFASVLGLSMNLELPEPMRERLTKTSEDFFETFPDSHYFRRIEGTPEKIIEFLKAQSDPWSIPAVQEVVERIRVGALPLSLLADITSKPYAELVVKGGIGSIVGESTDSAIRERERGIALGSIGHSVVVETSAVYCAMATQLPEGALLRLFPQTVAAQATVEDAIRSARDLALRSTASMRWDSVRESLVLSESSPEEAERWATEAGQAEGTLRTSSPKTNTERLDEVAKMPLILQPIQLAKELNLALYSDDVALRVLAESEGVRAFGTMSLLAAANESELLDDKQVAEATDALRRHFYADLPWTTEDLVRVAKQEELQPTGGAAGALARAAFWSNPVGASASYGSLLIEIRKRDEALDGVGGWQFAATIGVMRACNPNVRPQVAGGILAIAFLALDVRASVLPLPLDGAREGASALGADDPFPHFCRALLDQLAGILGEAEAGRMYVGMMQQLRQEDRAVAMRELLARREPAMPDSDQAEDS